jgi:hypothetical protein
MRTAWVGRVSHLALPLLAAAAYGFAIGAGKNLTYAWRSSVKFPLLLLGTALLCGLSTTVAARFVGAPLPFAAVQRTSSALLRSLAVLLGSTSPPVLLLARTSPLPGPRDLGGYPLFVGLNMVLVAIAGLLAVQRQHQLLVRDHALSRQQALVLVGLWLLLYLLVGGQLAFWLRPFFGIASLTGAPPFALGSEPTVTGATNFYEVVWQFVIGQDPGDYMRAR